MSSTLTESGIVSLARLLAPIKGVGADAGDRGGDRDAREAGATIKGAVTGQLRTVDCVLTLTAYCMIG